MGGTERVSTVRKHEEGVAKTSVEGCVSGSMSEDGLWPAWSEERRREQSGLKNSRGWLRVGDDAEAV